MKQITTILSCMLFVIAGALSIGFTKTKTTPSLFPGNATAYASSEFNPAILPKFELPLDLQLDLNKGAKIDTVFVTKTDTVYETKTKYITKSRKAVAPEMKEKIDTLYMPIFYLATPLEHEIESTEIRIIDDVHIINLSETNQIDSIERID